MYLSELSLVNFKNIKQADFQFSPQVNCFLGNNGQGKTNLLDAIYYLSYTKSFFNSIDSQNVNFESDFLIQTSNSHKISGLINFYGIESPGLTSALSIAYNIVKYYL